MVQIRIVGSKNSKYIFYNHYVRVCIYNTSQFYLQIIHFLNVTWYFHGLKDKIFVSMRLLISYFPRLIILLWCSNIFLQSAPFSQLRIKSVVFLFQRPHPQNKNYFQRSPLSLKSRQCCYPRSAIVVLGAMDVDVQVWSNFGSAIFCLAVVIWSQPETSSRCVSGRGGERVGFRRRWRGGCSRSPRLRVARAE